MVSTFQWILFGLLTAFFLLEFAGGTPARGAETPVLTATLYDGKYPVTVYVIGREVSDHGQCVFRLRRFERLVKDALKRAKATVKLECQSQ